MISPPSPSSVASAFIVTSLPTTVRLAFFTSEFFPWKSPPISTSPPPVSPEASTVTVSIKPTLSPVISMYPPSLEEEAAVINASSEIIAVSLA